MPHTLEADAKKKMDKSIEAFTHELGSLRTGRASVALLDSIEVDAYGSKMKLNQVGNIAAPESRMLMVTPWDKSQIGAIEKAIMASPLDLNPSNDGQVIRIPIPQLSEERRKDLVKLVGKYGEEAKISIRNVRRAIMEDIKKRQKDGDLPEDDAHKLSDKIQKLTDDHVKNIDAIVKTKDAEIMEV